MKCRICGCTDDNCSQCVQAQGYPCNWLEPDLCSRCTPKSPLSYKIILSFDLASALDKVGQITGSFNSHLAAMGCNERLELRSRACSMMMTVDRELSKKERTMIAGLFIGNLNSRCNNWHFRIESFRRQPRSQSNDINP